MEEPLDDHFAQGLLRACNSVGVEGASCQKFSHETMLCFDDLEIVFLMQRILQTNCAVGDVKVVSKRILNKMLFTNTIDSF